MSDPNVINSPNMGLPVPVPGADIGPIWAQNINNSLGIVDSHNHSAGNGVPIGPSGMNINFDLPMNDNSLTNVNSVQFFQGVLSSIPTLYTSGVDLIYDDGNGIVIPLTSGGQIAGASGNFSGVGGTVTASYSGGTFAFRSNTNVAGNLDGASVLLRNTSVSSLALTLSPPTLGSAFSFTLPNLPGIASSLFGLSTSGAAVVGNPISYDSVGSGMTSVGANSILSNFNAASLTYSPSFSVNTGSASSIVFHNANYYQIGKLVFINIWVEWTQSGGAAGSATIGLPFSTTILPIAVAAGNNVYGTGNPIGTSTTITFGRNDGFGFNGDSNIFVSFCYLVG